MTVEGGRVGSGLVVVFSPFVGGDYYGMIIRGANRAAVAAGARVMAVQTLEPGARQADGADLPTDVSLTATRQAGGVLVLPGALDAAPVQALQQAGVPVVLVGHVLPGVEAPVVGSDNHAGVRAAVDHLVGHGHRRIAFAGFTAASDIAERHTAYREALSSHGLGPGELIELPDNHETGGPLVAERLLADRGISALLLGTDRNAIGAVEKLRDAGFDVPRDVAVIGFDDLPECRYLVPALTSVRQPLDDLGAEAFRLVASLAAGREVEQKSVRVPTQLQVRASCGCPDPGLRLDEAQARAQFESLRYLQASLNTQCDLDVELLGAGQDDPRSLGWLAVTPAGAGVLGLWSPSPAARGGGPDRGGVRRLRIAGTYAAGDRALPVEVGAGLDDVDFPPAALFDAADGAADLVVFVVPVRGRTTDWGLLAAVGRIQNDTPQGCELMNHSSAVLTAALDRRVILEASQAQRDELQRLALHDQLTGLPNRAHLMTRLELAAQRARRNASYRYALIFVDLDGFKAVNDTHGHAVGDALLTVVAQRLTSVTRSEDLVARLGGDEFLLLIEGVADAEVVRGVVGRLRRALARPAVCDGVALRPAASIGVVTSRLGDSPDALLRSADAAMYRAKTRSSARR